MHNTVRRSLSSGVGSGDRGGVGDLGFLSFDLSLLRGGDVPGLPHRRSGLMSRLGPLPRPPGGVQRPKRGLPNRSTRSRLFRSPHLSLERLRRLLSRDLDRDRRLRAGDLDRDFFDFFDFGDLDLLFFLLSDFSPFSPSFLLSFPSFAGGGDGVFSFVG